MEVENTKEVITATELDAEKDLLKSQETASETGATTEEAESPIDIEDEGVLNLETLKVSEAVSEEEPVVQLSAEPESVVEVSPSDANVVALRKLLIPELSAQLTDNDCLRFLRARNNNVTKAAEMITKWGEWWETKLPGTEFLPREITANPDEKESAYRDLMPHANLGESKTGCPIYWEKTGQISSIFAEVKKRLSEDELFVRHIRQQEVMVRRLHNASERHGRPIEKQVIVMDMKNVAMSLDFMAIRTFKRTVVIDEACYPERLETLFMINAPFTFSVLWAMIKPWIDPVTVSKFRILGSNYQAELKAHIDESQIPVEYGGTWEDFGWTYPNNIAAHDRMPHY